jgi:predicted nucleic acid-binding protein
MNTLKLIDTSAWIDFFKAKNPYADLVDSALEEGTAAICGMIGLELRQGIK